MTAGDRVRALHMPDLGEGLVKWVGPRGLLLVAFDTPEGPYENEFAALELEMATKIGAPA